MAGHLYRPRRRGVRASGDHIMETPRLATVHEDLTSTGCSTITWGMGHGQSRPRYLLERIFEAPLLPGPCTSTSIRRGRPVPLLVFWPSLKQKNRPLYCCSTLETRIPRRPSIHSHGHLRTFQYIGESKWVYQHTCFCEVISSLEILQVIQPRTSSLTGWIARCHPHGQ